MTQQTPETPLTRRERRAAARRGEQWPAGRLSPRRGWRSPVLVVSVAALAVGVALIAVTALSTGRRPAASPITIPSGPGAGLVRPSTELPLNLADGRVLGRADAPATLEIWSDFQCPACGQLVREVEPRLFADYVIPGYLTIVYRDRAFLGAESVDAAVAARCADEQGKFWQYHDYLFFNQQGENAGAFARERFLAMADAVGLARDAFEACLDSGPPRQAAIAETSEGERVGVVTTPTLSIDGQLLPGAPASPEQYRALGDVLRRSIELGGGSLPPSPSTP